MPKKQSIEFCGITGLKESDVTVMKVLLNWPFALQRASFFHIAQKTGLSTSMVILAVRRLRDRGILMKSAGGSYFIKDPLRKKIIAEIGVLRKTDQRYIEAEDKPIQTEEEVDEILNGLIKSEDVLKDVDAKEKKHQRMKNMDDRVKKKINAKKYKQKVKK